MLSKIKRGFYKLAGINQRKPIIDDYIYSFNSVSYCGGSISDTNFLLVTNLLDTVETKKQILKEGVYLSELDWDDSNTIETFKQAGNKLIGPFTHIANVFEITNSNEAVQIKYIYQMLQQEADYLIQFAENQISTVTVVLIETEEDKCVISESIEGLVGGLSEVLGRHGILINGLLIENNIEKQVLGKWLCFLSSKYAHILTGNFLHLTNHK